MQEEADATTNANVVIEAGAPPYLAALGEEAWISFLGRLEGFRARGGTRPLRLLLSVSASEALADHDIDVSNADEKATLAEISKLFCPLTVVEAVERLRSVRMDPRVGFSLEEVMKYNQAFARTVRMCHEDVLPSKAKLVDVYLSNLRPRQLAECVRLREPRSLAEARKMAVEQVRTFATMETMMRVGQVGAAELRPRQAMFNETARRAGHEPAGRWSKVRNDDVRCFRCNERGHKAFECPTGQGNYEFERPTGGAATSRGTSSPRKLAGAHSGPLHDAPRPEAKATVGSQRGSPPGRSGYGTRISTGSIPRRGRRAFSVANATTANKQSEVPRVKIQLIAHDGAPVDACAVMDTGSDMCFVSSGLCQRLLADGENPASDDARVSVEQTEQALRTAGGEVTLSKIVRCKMVLQSEGVPAGSYDLVAGVLDVGENVLLGYPFLRKHGLLALLQAEAGDSASTPTARKVPWADQGLCNNIDAEGDELAEDETKAERIEVEAAANPALKAGIAQVLTEFADLFTGLAEGGADVEAMPIELREGCAPSATTPRRVSPAVQQVIDQEVTELLRLGVIVPSTSPYCSPLVVVRKKDGGRRVCVDFRAVNRCTQRMRFPMPHARELLDRMSGHQVFATLDLRSGFHQVPLEESARALTAFAATGGLYEYTRVPFGLTNAPQYFQKTMVEVLAGLVGTCCEVFVDDVIVYGKDDASFLVALRRVFERLRERNMRLKEAKCVFGLPEIHYLGHVVSGKGITLSQERRQAIATIKAPTTTAKLRSFMGLANYFRSFVRGFAGLAAPLGRLCSTKTKFKWLDEHEKAFNAIKQAVVDAPMLGHLDYAQEIILRTDASTVGIGGMLLQKDAREGGQERPICFISRAFSETERNWSTIEQEAYAIFYCVTSMAHYLLGHSFVVETDHRNLVFLDKAVAPKVVRWKLRLQEFDFTVRHIAGRSNVVADALSRCLLIRHQERIAEVHNDLVGHRGVRKSVELLRAMNLQWEGMRNDVSDYVSSCPTCQKTRLGQGSIAAATRTTMVHEPFEVIAVDTIGPLPEDTRGNQYIVVMLDCFTRFVELVPAADVSAESAAKALLSVVGRYGAPRFLRSDNGSQYTARMITTLLELMGSQRQLTIEYRPQSNGIAERANGEVMRHLRAIVMDRRVASTWSDQLPLVQRIVNATPHAALGTTPARVLFGDAIHLDRRLLAEQDSDQHDGGGRAMVVEDYIHRLTLGQRAIVDASDRAQRQVVEERLRKAAEENRDADGQVEEGDYVLATYPTKPPSKLSPRWKGPFVVAEVQGSTIKCQDLCTLRFVRFHRSRLKKYDAERTADMAEVTAVDGDEYVVEAIVDHRGNRRRRAGMEFRIRWRGYEPDDDTWLPFKQVKDLEALDRYAQDHPELRL